MGLLEHQKCRCGDGGKQHTESIYVKAENNHTNVYVDALQASHGKAMTSLMRDFGYVMDPTVVTKANATGHILHRLSVGRLKKIGVAHMWLQDEVRSSRLGVQRGECWANVADIGTKVLSNAVIAKHSLALEHSNMDSDGCRLRSKDGKDRDGSKKGTEVRVRIDQRSAAAGHFASVHETKR